ncbi:1,4-beta-xylanase [Nocardioides sp. zg-579]|uniref:Beta-xylanase n=1 Tax=Nocardioides marmotae TaxID=2663857 RepID=A0A6I3JFB5_9ACTN|nr:endo-1,4-beta-xylanase [Nocardioides marmotae]MCR6033113.1 1,4-beta-xylanase [Gordonia jinghuaiqii]MTB96765.1 1,4-beta-xylanase [Nocardioides marmotae]QKE03028.1 1,4-beta-xylanase [Nocardioides marmotae]
MTDAYEHRRGTASVTVRRADGTPLDLAEVVVEQRRHAVALGCIGFDLVPLAAAEAGLPTEAPGGGADVFGGAGLAGAEDLAGLWLDLFEVATLPFYWAGFEPEPGRTDTERLRAAARWFGDRDVAVKGHPLVWHTLAPDWLRGLPDDELEATVRARVRRETTDLAGLVGTWDAINEAVIMPVFANEEQENAITRLCRRLGRVETVRLAFEEARAGDPTATYVLNDFDMSPAYDRLVEEVLAAGVPVDAIGLQSHMHQGWWGEERTLEVLDRFARHGLPLHLTETTLLSGDLMPPDVEDLNDHVVDSWPSTPAGEERQAEEVVAHYRTLLAHPAVASVTYWGITDRGAWLGAPAGLVRADGSPKPAYDALHSLLREEWWLAPTTLRTDEAGRVEVSGWAGTYAVSAGGATADLTLPAGASTAEVVLG